MKSVFIFEDQLYKGNRTVKVNTEHFEAFESPNYPILAEAGVKIKYKKTPNTKKIIYNLNQKTKPILKTRKTNKNYKIKHFF